MRAQIDINRLRHNLVKHILVTHSETIENKEGNVSKTRNTGRNMKVSKMHKNASAPVRLFSGPSLKYHQCIISVSNCGLDLVQKIEMDRAATQRSNSLSF